MKKKRKNTLPALILSLHMALGGIICPVSVLSAQAATICGTDAIADVLSIDKAETHPGTDMISSANAPEDVSGLVSDQIYPVIVRGKIDIGTVINACIGDPTLSIGKYTSDSPKIAAVSRKGIVTGKKPGTTIISAYRKFNNQYILAGMVKVESVKPVFRFTKDLTYVGASMDSNNYLSDLPDGFDVRWSVRESKNPVISVDTYTGQIKALRRGNAMVTCTINSRSVGASPAAYTALVKVKPPFLKDSCTIRTGRTKKITLKNVSSYTNVSWSANSNISDGILEVIPTADQNVVLVKALQSSPAPLTLTATVDGQKYTMTITVK